jgi:hypothetical protein
MGFHGMLSREGGGCFSGPLTRLAAWRILANPVEGRLTLRNRLKFMLQSTLLLNFVCCVLQLAGAPRSVPFATTVSVLASAASMYASSFSHFAYETVYVPDGPAQRVLAGAVGLLINGRNIADALVTHAHLAVWWCARITCILLRLPLGLLVCGGVCCRCFCPCAACECLTNARGMAAVVARHRAAAAAAAAEVGGVTAGVDPAAGVPGHPLCTAYSAGEERLVGGVHAVFDCAARAVAAPRVGAHARAPVLWDLRKAYIEWES